MQRIFSRGEPLPEREREAQEREDGGYTIPKRNHHGRNVIDRKFQFCQ